MKITCEKHEVNCCPFCGSVGIHLTRNSLLPERNGKYRCERCDRYFVIPKHKQAKRYVNGIPHGLKKIIDQKNRRKLEGFFGGRV